MSQWDSKYIVRVTFVWSHGGEKVEISGSMIGWDNREVLHRVEDGRFMLDMDVVGPAKVIYKFIVDGEWRHDPNAPTEVMACGTINNVLELDEGLCSSLSFEVEQNTIPASDSSEARRSTEVGKFDSVASGKMVPKLLLSNPSKGYIGDGVLREYSEEFGLDTAAISRHYSSAQKLRTSVSCIDFSKTTPLLALSPVPATAEVEDVPVGLEPSQLIDQGATHPPASPKASTAVPPRQTLLSAPIATAPEALSAPTASTSGRSVPLHSPTHSAPQSARSRAGTSTPASTPPLTAAQASASQRSRVPRLSIDSVEQFLPGLQVHTPATATHTKIVHKHGQNTAAAPSLFASPRVGRSPSSSISLDSSNSIDLHRSTHAPSFVTSQLASEGTLPHWRSAEPSATTMELPLEPTAQQYVNMDAKGGAAVNAIPTETAHVPEQQPPSATTVVKTVSQRHSGQGTGAAPPPPAPTSSPSQRDPSFLGMPLSPTMPELYTHAMGLLRQEGKLVIIMVGLPARGKTFMAKRLQRYLAWQNIRVQIFNVGNYRRSHFGASQPHSFFDPHNKEGAKARENVARLALEELLDGFRNDLFDIAIYDATNSTKQRRDWVEERIQEEGGKFKCLFIESQCSIGAIIQNNVRDTKLRSPDYQGLSEQQAIEDFLNRIRHYEDQYEPLDAADNESDRSYMKIIDVGRRIILNRVSGYLKSKISIFLSNLNINPPVIYLSRHGESEYNVAGKIGGDSDLSTRGKTYAQKLTEYIKEKYPPGTDLIVWTSTLRRTIQTAKGIGREIVTWKALDEIDAGICDGMTYEEIAKKYPLEYEMRRRNKFFYRYPRGESYLDLVHRLEPLILELGRLTKPVLIIGHQATLRVLLAYLTDQNPKTCPDTLMPLHTLVSLQQSAYETTEIRVPLI